jgi:hypothetical protein
MLRYVPDKPVARHLEGLGTETSKVESMIESQIRSQLRGSSTISKSFEGKISFEGKTIVYRAFAREDGQINVGTYFIPDPGYIPRMPQL